MITVYASDEKLVVDYSGIIDTALLKLREELRTDLSQINRIEWSDDRSVAIGVEDRTELIEQK